jgi:hypothetical protein
MNRRTFIKSAGMTVALPAIAITCKYEDDEKGSVGIIEFTATNESKANGALARTPEAASLIKESIRLSMRKTISLGTVTVVGWIEANYILQALTMHKILLMTMLELRTTLIL